MPKSKSLNNRNKEAKMAKEKTLHVTPKCPQKKSTKPQDKGTKATSSAESMSRI